MNASTPEKRLDAWEADLAGVREAATAHSSEPVLLIGDFNAVREHLPMRRLAASGLSDAADQTGAGWLPTFPANRWYPPLFAIDHVMVNDRLRVVSLSTFDVKGADHLGRDLGQRRQDPRPR